MKKWLLLPLLWLAGCQGADGQATMIAQNNGYATEFVTINQTLAARRSEVDVTVQAAEIQVTQIEAINQQWLALMLAGITPTPGVVADVAPIEVYSGTAVVGGFSDQFIGANQVTATQDSQIPSSDAGTATAIPPQFADISTALSVGDSDGCIDTPQSIFTSYATHIYLGARASSINAGTQMSVDWSLETQVVWQDSWTVPQNATDFCLWFYIGPEYLALTPGNWSAQLYANGTPVASAIQFVITAP